MKKNFFKKLSFVLALAMIISVVAPAAGAFAATKVKLNSTKKYLHLGVDGSDEYNFNVVSKKGTGWKYSWESSNEDVAVVNAKNGVVTAAGVGTAKVTLTIVDKDGEEVGEAKATVVVRDNIKDLTITNKPAGDKVSVGVAQDFNRSFVTVSGSKKVTSAITRWSVEPATGATIDDKGVFTATVAGEYTITATAYQSKAKYEAKQPIAGATDTYKVTVPVEIKEIKQLNANKFVAEFNTDVSKTLTKDNAFVYQVINGKLVATGSEKIKEVKFDGNKATVEIYGTIGSEKLYSFVYGDATGSFTGAKKALEEVAGLVFDNFTVSTEAGAKVDVLTKISGVNKDGVAIYTGTELAPYISDYKYEGDYANGWLSGSDLYITKNGYSAVVSVKYTNFVLDSATNTYKTVEYTAQATATGVATALNTSSMQFVIKKSATMQDGTAAWATTGLAVPAGDGGYYIHTRYKNNTDDADDWNYTNDFATFTYETTNADKLIITGNNLYPISQGVVTVLVKKGTDVVNTFDLTIMAGRTFATATPDKQSVTLGNKNFGAASPDNEYKEVVIWAKDSMNEGIAVTGTASVVTGPKDYVTPPVVDLSNLGTGDDLGKVTAKVTATDATPGAYNIKITLTSDSTFNFATKEFNIYVVVTNAAASEGAAVRWALELTSSDIDLKKIDENKSIGVKVYGYNKHNARVEVLDPATEYTLTVKKGNDTIKTVGTGFTTSSIPVAVENAVSGAYDFVDLGSYVVTAFAEGASNPTGRNDGVYIDAKPFVVKDTTEAKPIPVTLSVAKTTGMTIADAVKAAYNFKINDVDMETLGAAATWAFDYSVGSSLVTNNAGTTEVPVGNLYVSAVKITIDFGGADVTYTIKVGNTITVTQ